MLYDYLNGVIAALDTGLAVVDCNGVGYACWTTGYTQSKLQIGQRHKLYTYTSIREDAFDLYGFASREERTCFERLVGVTGVGPKAALAILTAATPDQVSMAVLTGDEKTLTAAAGVGKKLAPRILLELKDKVRGEAMTATGGGAPLPLGPGGKVAEASAALAALGYSQAEIGASLRGVDTESLSVEAIVRQCLRAMVTG